MTRSKASKLEVLNETLENLQSSVKIVKSMGMPLARVADLEHAITSVKNSIAKLESK